MFTGWFPLCGRKCLPVGVRSVGGSVYWLFPLYGWKCLPVGFHSVKGSVTCCKQKCLPVRFHSVNGMFTCCERKCLPVGFRSVNVQIPHVEAGALKATIVYVSVEMVGVGPIHCCLKHTSNGTLSGHLCVTVITKWSLCPLLMQ